MTQFPVHMLLAIMVTAGWIDIHDRTSGSNLMYTFDSMSITGCSNGRMSWFIRSGFLLQPRHLWKNEAPGARTPRALFPVIHQTATYDEHRIARR